MLQTRHLKLAATSYDVREEMFEGRKHLVVPVVALVQGVLHAMNSATPELVTAEEFTRPAVVGGFNGRPLFHGHPVRNGEPVPGNTPELLETEAIGRVFNAAVKNNKLVVEAWIDVEKCEAVAPELLERVRNAQAIEISVGVYCESDDDEKGEYDGKKYAGSWRDIVPEHLALLSAEDTGACSIEMGCGVRAAKKGDSQVKLKDKTKGSLFARIMSAFRAEQAPEQMSDNDVRRNLYEALRALDSTVNYVEAFYPNASPATVVYSCWFQSAACGVETSMGYQTAVYQRSYSVGDNGVVTLGDDVMEVEPILTYQPVPADVTAASQAPIAAQGAPCKCEDHKDTRSAIEMTKEQIAKFLETATEEQIKALAAVAEGKTVATPVATEVVEPATKVVETTVVETPVVAAAKTPTFEEVLAAADATTRDSINEGRRVASERRASSIKALKDTGRCTMSDEALASKTQEELDQFVALTGAPKVDFSVAGASRAQDQTNEIPAALDLTAAVRAARGIK